MTDTKDTKPNRPRRMAREPQPEAPNGAAHEVSPTAPNAEEPSATSKTKAGLVEELLVRADGASLGELCQATGWQPHSARAFLTGLRKKGKALERAKREDKTTFYKLVAAEVG
jgi:hypothetical protein